MKNNILNQLLGSVIFKSLILTIIFTILMVIFDNVLFLIPPVLYILFLVFMGFKNMVNDFKNTLNTCLRIPKGKKRPAGIRKLFFIPVFKNIKLNYKYRIESRYDYKDNKFNQYTNKLYGFSAIFFPRIRKYDKKYSNNTLTNLFKLFGYSFILPHHWESYRWGWRYAHGYFYYSAYYYEKGELKIKTVEILSDVEWVQLGLINEDNHVLYQYNGRTIIDLPTKFKLGYKLKPYTLDEIGVPNDIYIFYNRQ